MRRALFFQCSLPVEDDDEGRRHIRDTLRCDKEEPLTVCADVPGSRQLTCSDGGGKEAPGVSELEHFFRIDIDSHHVSGQGHVDKLLAPPTWKHAVVFGNRPFPGRRFTFSLADEGLDKYLW